MNIIFKIISLCLTMAILFSLTAFAEGLLVPVRETFENYGFTVTWDQGTKSVTLEKDGYKFVEAVGENITLDFDTTYATEEFINGIYADYMREALSTKATVKEVGEGYILADSEKLGEVIFTVDNNTNIHHEMNRMRYTISDITAGMAIKVYYSEAMTASIPPQTYASEIVVLNVEGKLAVSGLSQVFTVTDKGEGYILASNEAMGEVMFMTDENTAFRHERNRRLYTIADVEIGTNLQITFSEAMTASIPPQTYASDVVFLDTPVEENEALTTTGKVILVTEEYFTIEKEDGSTFRFNCDDQTNIHHAMNRRLYRLSDLEEGMEVEVIHAAAATFSLPPQSYAVEVIIK